MAYFFCNFHSTVSRLSVPGGKQSYSVSVLQDEILQDTDELQVELECLMKECKKVVRQRTLLQQEQQGIAEVIMNAAAQSKASAHPRYSQDNESCSGNITLFNLIFIYLFVQIYLSDKMAMLTNTLTLSQMIIWVIKI